jgi:hypothetical protein
MGSSFIPSETRRELQVNGATVRAVVHFHVFREEKSDESDANAVSFSFL